MGEGLEPFYKSKDISSLELEEYKEMDYNVQANYVKEIENHEDKDNIKTWDQGL